MARPAPRTPVLLFGFLAFYILLQSAWWMWLLVSKGQDVFALQEQLLAEGLVPLVPVRLPKHMLLMVLGEGMVFLVLLLLALWITFRTLRQELALARQQRDFLMAASHELRTPIAALKLHLQTLQRPDLNPESRETLASNARHDVARLHALAEQILLASRLEEQAITPQWEEVDIAALAHAMLEEARASYGREHLLHGEAPGALLLWTDPSLFRTVLGNLLENACKYSPPGSSITVTLGHQQHQVQLRVTDQGAGIPEAERPLMFRKFHRGGDEATRSTKGTGLGLFIVRRLMEDLGGRIEYRPAQPNGSTFIATFPDRT
ncbi:MAG TPA: HAMP domain-containing sensor histidine kinase [Flavobacteriales bacterium]|nr:HAMP domain-containing sensor histidine kinase [Flavobacteriales bacterium]